MIDYLHIPTIILQGEFDLDDLRSAVEACGGEWCEEYELLREYPSEPHWIVQVMRTNGDVWVNMPHAYDGAWATLHERANARQVHAEYEGKTACEIGGQASVELAGMSRDEVESVLDLRGELQDFGMGDDAYYVDIYNDECEMLAELTANWVTRRAKLEHLDISRDEALSLLTDLLASGEINEEPTEGGLTVGYDMDTEALYEMVKHLHAAMSPDESVATSGLDT